MITEEEIIKLQDQIKKLNDRVEYLETKRLVQQDFLPDVVKMRAIGEGVRYIRSGLAADIPTPETPMQGSPLYFCTDTGDLKVYDGSAWLTTNLS